jgi:hypothetical protein
MKWTWQQCYAAFDKGVQVVLPDLIPVRQLFVTKPLIDVAQAMQEALRALGMERHIRPGMRVGIPVGSRGIRNLPLMVREMVEAVRTLGGEPLVVAAMGSHGGGTAEGQLQVLSSLGVDEQSVGAPVVGNVEAEEIGCSEDGHPVYFDSLLLRCDAVLVMNRVKPHTSFRGKLESGVVKMLVVGCGKPKGAEQFHSFGPLQLAQRLEAAVQVILRRVPLVGGIAVLETAREETADLVPLSPDSLIASEERLLEIARQMLPRLPITELDLLIVDRMGKEISGTGMDTNVIGRIGVRGVPDAGPDIARIVVLDLTVASHGNANGMGLADLVTRRLAEKVDFSATYLNSLTATFVDRAKLPIVLDSDRAVIATALQTLGNPKHPRIIRIASTLELEHLLVSPAVLEQLGERSDIVTEGPAAPWIFDSNGNISNTD